VGATAGVLFLACVATSPFVPFFDPDEAYYPATAQETLATKAFWDLHLDGHPRWDKPILTYALIEAAFVIGGPHEVVARLPSALEGSACVVVAGFVTADVAGPLAGVIAALVLASTLGLQIFARAAHPEIAVVLSIFTTELLFVLWLADDGRHRAALVCFAALSIGYGILAKGPVAVALPALAAGTALPLLRPRPALRRVLTDGALAVAAGVVIAIPWYAVMTAEYGWPFLRESLWRHNVMRYSTDEFGHRASVFFFVVPTAVALLPWTPLLPSALRGLPVYSPPRRRLAVCMLAAAASAFAFYSFSSTKLPNYALVIVPPLAIVVALRLAAAFERTERASQSETVAAVTQLLVGLVLTAIPIAIAEGTNARVLLGGAPSRSSAFATSLWVVVLPAATVCVAAAAAVWFTRRRVLRIAALTAAGFLLPLALLSGAAPLLGDIYPWRQFGRDLAGRPGSLWLYRYRAPSLTFYARRPVLEIVEEEQLQEVFAHGSGWLVVDDRVLESIALHHSHTKVVSQRGRMRLLRVGNPK
jgi:4-amino-4-deoxy-L-arabinose transferase-like glycosyltransferase